MSKEGFEGMRGGEDLGGGGRQKPTKKKKKKKKQKIQGREQRQRTRPTGKKKKGALHLTVCFPTALATF